MAYNHEIITPMNLSCRDIPHGMKAYILRDLTAHQQRSLNQKKIDSVRGDQKYLAAHPEIRAIVALIIRMLMKQRPVDNFYEAIATNFFLVPQGTLRAEIKEYLSERGEVLGVNSTEEFVKKQVLSHHSVKSPPLLLHQEPDEQVETPKSDSRNYDYHVTIDERDWDSCSKSVRDVLGTILDKVEAIVTSAADETVEEEEHEESIIFARYKDEDLLDMDMLDVMSYTSIASTFSAMITKAARSRTGSSSSSSYSDDSSP